MQLEGIWFKPTIHKRQGLKQQQLDQWASQQKWICHFNHPILTAETWGEAKNNSHHSTFFKETLCIPLKHPL
jgi:hypothetical protein